MYEFIQRQLLGNTLQQDLTEVHVIQTQEPKLNRETYRSTCNPDIRTKAKHRYLQKYTQFEQDPKPNRETYLHKSLHAICLPVCLPVYLSSQPVDTFDAGPEYQIQIINILLGDAREIHLSSRLGTLMGSPEYQIQAVNLNYDIFPKR